MKKKYIFVTGGVFSSLGKGIISASLGKIFTKQKKKVFIQKLDPYFNLNAGKMNPFQHGEVYVTKDGYETDLDLGHYERFLGEELLGKYANVTAGQIYSHVLKKEKEGQYLGETIQTMPHITSEIKQKIYEVHKKLKKEILIVEIGGTVGDIESLSFLEACRQIRSEVGRENVVFIHVVYLPFLKTSREFKTKPAQHSVKQLLTCGIQPQIIICRSDKKAKPQILKKISLFCSIEKQYIINVPNLKSIYQVPFVLEKQKLGKKISNFLNINFIETSLSHQKSKQITKRKLLTNKQTIIIKIFGKYGTFPDNYLSIIENLKFASQKEKVKLKIEIVDVMKINWKNESNILNCDGVIIAGGFGKRGIEEKIKVAELIRKQRVPFLGICLGMQISCLEIARNVYQIKEANSTEFSEKTLHPLFVLNKKNELLIGEQKIKINEDNPSFLKIYHSQKIIKERFRCRYQFNHKYVSTFNQKIFTAHLIQQNIPCSIQIPELPYYIAVQYHPEFTAKTPHPLFQKLIEVVVQEKIKKPII